MKALVKDHTAPMIALALNLVATTYACFDGTVSKELFILYGLTTTGLYGYSQQSQIKTADNSSGSEPKNDL